MTDSLDVSDGFSEPNDSRVVLIINSKDLDAKNCVHDVELLVKGSASKRLWYQRTARLNTAAVLCLKIGAPGMRELASEGRQPYEQIVFLDPSTDEPVQILIYGDRHTLT